MKIKLELRLTFYPHIYLEGIFFLCGNSWVMGHRQWLKGLGPGVCLQVGQSRGGKFEKSLGLTVGKFNKIARKADPGIRKKNLFLLSG